MTAAGTGPTSDASKPGVTPAVHLQEPLDPYGMLAQSLADRTTLVQLCLYALDRARSDGVAQRIERGLAGVGVAAVRPTGLPFDPSRHEAAGTVPTDDVTLAGLIAETELPGFVDQGRVLRVPVVTVYRLRAGA